MGKTRVENVVGKRALHTIQSADDEGMYITVADAAVYMATVGFLDEANALLGRLWSYDWPHSQNAWLADQGLTVLWYAAGSWPDDIPFAPEPIDRIELAHRRYMATDQWGGPVPTKSWQELDGLDLFRRSLRLAYPRREDGSMPSAACELEALDGLDKYIAAFDEPNGYNFGKATCLAAELAARQGRVEQATRLAMWWAERYPLSWTNYSFECMACNRHMASLLLRVVLAASLGLTAASCRGHLEGLLAAVDARARHGRTLVYGDWSWGRLLTAIRELTMGVEPEPDPGAQEEHGDQLIDRPRATGEAVAAAETRLHIQLPPDYRAFIRASNGFSPTGDVSPWLLPIEEVDYLRNIADPEIFGIYKDYAGDDMPESIEACILVSDREAEEMVLLIPPLREGAEWQTWFFAHWIPGEVRYPSFRHYMEVQLQRLLEDS